MQLIYMTFHFHLNISLIFYCDIIKVMKGIDIMPKNELLKRDRDVASKLLTMDKVPWNTIPDAMKEIDDLRESEDEYNMDILEEIDEYIQELEETNNNTLKQ